MIQKIVDEFMKNEHVIRARFAKGGHTDYLEVEE